jgi:hypothetical protein
MRHRLRSSRVGAERLWTETVGNKAHPPTRVVCGGDPHTPRSGVGRRGAGGDEQTELQLLDSGRSGGTP